MDELVKKISSYHIFNYLIPGVIAAFLIDSLFNFNFKFVQNSVIVGVFFYYFLGSIISRVGSLISPFIDWVFSIEKTNYKDYINAEKNDPKIEILAEINNMYRSFYSLFLILNIVNFKYIYMRKDINLSVTTFLVLAFFIYVFSYKKQTGFIVGRVKSYISPN
ncbi:hypothetical protein [Photorhabdus heterorhabditis]|uniref:hypothetical protein n=1 Tax=Photorhabdus heterorhabditis TaxID=880156 RepID=UPI001BD54666|nr:hypothetical protein [Photorhabdus heterorhabditis]MBS9443238.1 hypothetical protein [Photorhabdus heterorhabditis]